MLLGKNQHYILLCLFLALPGQGIAAKCDFLPKQERPDWVSKPVELPGFYTGVGLAEKGGLSAAEQIKVARQNALQDMAGGIKVSVKDTLLVKEALRSSGSDTTSEKNVESVTQTVTEQSLEQVQVDQTWLDQDKCIVWIRVKVERSLVEKAQAREYEKQKLAVLNDLLGRAENSGLPVGERANAVKLAKLQMNDIDFTAAESALGKDALLLKLKQLEEQLKSVAQKQDKTKEWWGKVAKLELAVDGNSSPSEKEDMANEAINLLRQIIYAAPMEPGIAEAEQAYFKIADFEHRRNNACSVRIQYEIVASRSPSAQWREQAKTKLPQYACDDKQRETFDWRVLLEGRNVEVNCAFKTNNKPQLWQRACSDIITHIKQFGANIVSGERLSAQQVLHAAAKAGANNFKSPRGQAITIFITASGDIKTRKNTGNPQGKDYQYNGDVATYLVINDRLEAADTFNGVGGWNPVSEQMAMDVLAINVVKRWKQRTLKFIHKDA